MPVERSAPPFLDALRASGLLTAAQLDELARCPEAREAAPTPLARIVYQRGWLTRYQLNAVAVGRAKDLIIGPYVILDRLGEGGMGMVYKARHQHMQRIVALKVIRKERLANPEAVERFYREVRAAAQLAHPNIVMAYDAGEAGSTHYLSMEYVEGVDLARLVKEKGPLPVAQACEYIRQAALGLQHASERGLVHRDIKPHNLLVSRADKESKTTARGDVVKILDMGLARLQTGGDTGMTKDGAVIGTPDYLAPEQALNSKSADVRADLYSLGGTLYFLLTGQPPFLAEELTELLLKHQMEQPAPLADRGVDAPYEVQEILDRLLAKRPEERFQTPAELVAAITPFCREGKLAENTFNFFRHTDGDGNGEWGTRTLDERKAKRTERPTRRDAGPTRSEAEQRRKNVILLAAGGSAAVLALALFALVLYLVFGRATPEPAVQRQPPAESAKNIPVETPAERKAAEWALSLGGKVRITRPAEAEEHEITRSGDLPAKDFKLVAIELWGKREVNDTGLANIRGLPDLQRLILNGTSVSDTGLAGLKDLPKLAVLDLGGTQVTNAGLASLQNLKELAVLHLDGVHTISDAGLAHVKDLRRLQILSLRRTSVTGNGLRAIEGLRDLHTLNLSEVPIKDEGLTHLRSLSSLTVLELLNTGITDAGLASLSGLGRLQTLTLERTTVSDEGLKHLRELTGLRVLDLRTTQVTTAGVQELQKSLRGCQVKFTPASDIVLEAEALRVLGKSGDFPVDPENMSRYATKDVAWSGNAQLRAVPRRVGDWVELTFSVPVHGHYRGSAWATQAGDYGKIRLLVNGILVGPVIDESSSGAVTRIGPIDIGIVELRRGPARLRVNLAAVGNSATSLSWGLDLIRFTPVRPGDTTTPQKPPEPPSTITKKEPFTGHTGEVLCVAFSADGKKILTGGKDHTVRLWEVADGHEIDTYKGPTGPVTQVAFTGKGKQVVAVAAENGHWAWDIAASGAVIFEKRTGPRTAWAISPDGELVVFPQKDFAVFVRRTTDNGRSDRQFSIRDSGDVIGAAFFPHKEWVIFATSADGLIHVGDMSTRKEIGKPFPGPKAETLGLAVAPNEKSVLITDDKGAALWSLQTIPPAPHRRLEGLKERLLCFAFTPDGKHIAGGLTDSTVRVWDAATGKEVRRFTEHQAPVHGVAFSPDGKTIASCSDGIKLWEWQKQPAKP
jgi:serine/threonine protein kinase/WD40 repeat protein